MTRHVADAQAHTLGSFLRSLRERQSPSAHGIAPHSRRRTSGLRREEVAQICGLSSTWYTWIEQGREVSVSSSTVGPAYILDRMWTARRWNAKAAHLFFGWLGPEGERNLARYIFLRPEARQLICDWEERSHRVTAEFRAAITGHMDEPNLCNLISDLSRHSADFARCWDMHGVVAREGGLRTFNHPADGFVRYQQVSLTIAGWPDFRLTMLLGPAMA